MTIEPTPFAIMIVCLFLIVNILLIADMRSRHTGCQHTGPVKKGNDKSKQCMACNGYVQK